ncbi:MAG TPA: ATP-binding protein [Candidatus Polarisedimenticolaceae bacterium]|nr:ATP-binding protein [Candidatus Polarisedimenticolaceae bacterium]
MREAATHDWPLSSDPVRFRRARARLIAVAHAAGFGPRAAHDLAVAFSEACANIHHHAYEGRRDGRVEVRVTVEDDRIVVRLDHDGKRFEPARYAPPDLGRASESGYGLYLIAHLVDDVSYEDAAGGGRVVLVKHRRADAGG